MSVAIATMGMFIPQTGSGGGTTVIIDKGGGGGAGHWEGRQPKPQVIVRRVETDALEAEIKITLLHVEEE